MAFEWRGGVPPYTEFEVYEDDGSLVLRRYIGRDGEKGATYFVALLFSPHLDDSREFSFCILENLTPPNRSRTYQSGRDTALFIPRDARPMILEIVVSGIGELLRLECPLNIYRITADSYPPEPALEKHQRIGEAFKQHGYNLWACDSHYGQRVWIMTRLDEQAYRRWRAEIEADDSP